MEFYVSQNGTVIKGRGASNFNPGRRYRFSMSGKRLTITGFDGSEEFAVFGGKVAKKSVQQVLNAMNLREDQKAALIPAISWSIENIGYGGRGAPEAGFQFR